MKRKIFFGIISTLLLLTSCINITVPKQAENINEQEISTITTEEFSNDITTIEIISTSSAVEINDLINSTSHATTEERDGNLAHFTSATTISGDSTSSINNEESLVTTIGLSNLYVYVTPEPTEAPTVEVPNVLGQSIDSVRSQLKNELGFTVLERELYSIEAPEGSIISISPAPGEKVERGSRVTVTISRGRNNGPVPDVTGNRLNDSIDYLNSIGFSTTVQIPSNLAGQEDELYVVSMSPDAGTSNVQNVTIIAGTYADANPTPTPIPTTSVTTTTTEATTTTVEETTTETTTTVATPAPTTAEPSTPA